jgi:hypothetical protein
MRTRLIAVVLGAVLVLTGCLTTEPSEATLGEVFELAPQQSALITGAAWTIGFRGVSQDTRCPVETECLVAGEAGIQLDIFGTDARNPVVLTTGTERSSWDDTHYRVSVVDLTPSPSSSRTIQPEDYRLRLVVESLAP